MTDNEMYIHRYLYAYNFRPAQIGTGFVGYMKCKKDYSTVLMTNNHVIPSENDATGSRIVFDNLLPGQQRTLEGSKIFKKNGFYTSEEVSDKSEW